MNTKGLVLHAVTWMDAHYNTSDVDAAEVYHHPWQYVTVGILVKSDNEGVTVASDVGQDGKYRCINFIPRGMIVDEYPLGPITRRRQRKLKPVPPSSSPSSPI